MARYKIVDTTVVDSETGKIIPMDTHNADYQEYLAWVDEGNDPDPDDYSWQ